LLQLLWAADAKSVNVLPATANGVFGLPVLVIWFPLTYFLGGMQDGAYGICCLAAEGPGECLDEKLVMILFWSVTERSTCRFVELAAAEVAAAAGARTNRGKSIRISPAITAPTQTITSADESANVFMVVICSKSSAQLKYIIPV
jgi:hypothetical protein